MTTLAENEGRLYEDNEDRLLDDLPMIADDIIFEGAAVGESVSTGTFRPLVAGDVFGGFAAAKADNTGGAAADQNVRVRKRGTIKIPVTGVVGNADVGATVYAIDDNDFTLTAGGNTAIGKLGRVVSGTTVMVRFEAAQVQSV